MRLFFVFDYKSLSKKGRECAFCAVSREVLFLYIRHYFFQLFCKLSDEKGAKKTLLYTLFLPGSYVKKNQKCTIKPVSSLVSLPFPKKRFEKNGNFYLYSILYHLNGSPETKFSSYFKKTRIQMKKREYTAFYTKNRYFY